MLCSSKSVVGKKKCLLHETKFTSVLKSLSNRYSPEQAEDFMMKNDRKLYH